MARYQDTPTWLDGLAPDALGPLSADLTLGRRPLDPAVLEAALADHLTDERRARIEAVLERRTYGLVPVVEGLVNGGNVRAVMRTAEGLGCQAFHVIGGADKFKDSARTSQGAEKWIDVYRWSTPNACTDYLHARGYQIVVTHLDATAVPIAEVDFTRPTALVFGNEQEGVSEAMLRTADVRCLLPLDGFVQSYNISVAAALALYHGRTHRLAHLGHHGDLTKAERARLRAAFYRRSVRAAEAILERKLGQGYPGAT
ncbi:MAG: RNA methyltransferase [Bacteroidota bacterium]